MLTRSWIFIAGEHLAKSAALPLRGVGFDYVLGREHTRTELYLQRSEAAENLALFHALFQRKEELEEVFGSTLEWSPLPQRAGCRVRFRLEHGGWSDPGSWPAVVPATVDAMLRFSKALTEPVLTSGRRLGLR